MSQATEEKLEMYEGWREAKKEERAEAEDASSQEASQTDSWDVGEVIDPPEATIQVGPHKLIFRELTYKQAKGLFGITGRILSKVLAHPTLETSFLVDPKQGLLVKLGPLLEAASDEIIELIAKWQNIPKDELEAYLKAPHLVDILNTIIAQNRYQIQLTFEHLKKTEALAKELGLSLINLKTMMTQATGEILSKG